MHPKLYAATERIAAIESNAAAGYTATNEWIAATQPACPVSRDQSARAAVQVEHQPAAREAEPGGCAEQDCHCQAGDTGCKGIHSFLHYLPGLTACQQHLQSCT